MAFQQGGTISKEEMGRRGPDEAGGGIMLDWGAHQVSPGPGVLWALPGVGWVMAGQGGAWCGTNLRT